MARMGHDNERAALIYLPSSVERQRALADEVGRAAAAELAKLKLPKSSGREWHEPAHMTLVLAPCRASDLGAPTATRTRDLPLQRSFHAVSQPAVFLVRAAFLVVLVLLDACGFHVVRACGGHAGSNYGRRGDGLGDVIRDPTQI
jgi:hypothetical protein